jgi:DNA processing protein
VTPLRLSPLDPGYPVRLRGLVRPPAELSVRGGSLDADRVVAVVGSREAHPDAREFAGILSAALVGAGVVVVSGGALGIDAAAHVGALDAGGRTWVVAGTGCEHCFPPEHAALFARVAEGPGAMIWPFAPSSNAHAGSFRARNRVLVALSDAVVVVQAGLMSGALNAASSARKLERPLWVVPASTWLGAEFDGSRQLLDEGARPLQSVDALLRSLSPSRTAPSAAAASNPSWPLPRPPSRPLSEAEQTVLAATSSTPVHLDEIASRTPLPTAAVTAALLTLALEDVVVEGPQGCFRRKNPP